MLTHDPRTSGGAAGPDEPLPPSSALPMNEAELEAWLDEHATEIARRWGVELRARAGRDAGPLDTLRGEIAGALVLYLGPAVSPWRDEVEPLMHQVAVLYGNLGGLRGLAAGEVVEEVQVLREVLLRLLFRSGGGDSASRIVNLRELLRLNRVVDQVVTHANVAHIDTLFFNLLHGTGSPSRRGRNSSTGSATSWSS
jgi:hypothetical protein